MVRQGPLRLSLWLQPSFRMCVNLDRLAVKRLLEWEEAAGDK
jgi:hypothetical protein